MIVFDDFEPKMSKEDTWQELPNAKIHKTKSKRKKVVHIVLHYNYNNFWICCTVFCLGYSNYTFSLIYISTIVWIFFNYACFFDIKTL